jgi:transcriptional regulator with XRE-family HTH domain
MPSSADSFARLAAYRGLLARVAKRLHVSRSSVTRVVNGERRSARIDEAIAAELARLETRVQLGSRAEMNRRSRTAGRPPGTA